MKLWHVYRTGDIGYKEHSAFVIRADCEYHARKLASESKGNEGAAVWFSLAVKAEEITTEGELEIILSSFNAG